MSGTKKKRKGTKGSTSAKGASGVNRDVYLWLSLAVCTLLLLSNFGLGGKAGNVISRFLFGLFGAINYVLPIGLLIGIFFAISNKGNRIAEVKLWASVLFIIFLDGIIDLFGYGSDLPSPGRAYLISYRDRTGGGFFGAVTALIFSKAFGALAAGILLLIFMIICTVLITERGFLSHLIDRKDKDIQRPAREDKKRAEEKPDKPPARKRKAIKGVALTPSFIKNEKVKDHKDGLREITADQIEDDDKADDKEIELPQEIEKQEVDLHSGCEVKTNIHIPDERPPEPDPVVPDPEDIEASPVEAAESGQDSRKEPESLQQEETFYEAPVEQKTKEPACCATATDPSIDKSLPKKKDYIFPTFDLLKQEKQNGNANTRESLQETADKLSTTLHNFGVNAQVTEVTCGPTVTRFEIHPEIGVKVSKIVNLADDIKLNLAASDIRIEAPIPGKSAIGIEVPNKHTQVVPFREMMESDEFRKTKSRIAFAAGKDIAGKVIVSDIAKMPHLLIAGATGSGKSVCINTIIMSILFKARPDEVRFIMIDPKVVELSIYNGIPHLMTPVVTDPKKAAGALQWAVNEMTDRYKKFAQTGVRDIKGYNARIKNGKIGVRDKNGETVMVETERMPQIIVIVDELADLMMQCPKEVEGAICRLAQLARACGIHLVIATQRPSVDVITGLIKANMPSRIAFAVTSGVDSRTILDMNGAEKLLGKGDMLYFPQGLSKPERVQGAFVPDEDVSRVVDYIKKMNGGDAEYDSSIEESIEESTPASSGADRDGNNDFDQQDQYFADAAYLIIDKQKGSIGMLQRNFKIGFNRAARIMDQLEEAGVVGAETGTKPRAVLMTKEEFDNYLEGI
ncbi:DNA translocase FtsK 4TM domain-containing protein [Candidatus Weimeria sp. HCP3S3_B5]|uniref:FtsK/SpoIIIE family DNA translocase n=1 Tax=Candidatus Weimeria sp. HCP3S3_B5 TaxID=3438871 RepID=UPI003F8A6F8F